PEAQIPGRPAASIFATGTRFGERMVGSSRRPRPFRYNQPLPHLKEILLQQAEIGIMGGSGLYSMPGLTDIREVTVQTPFGETSDAFVLGTLEGRKVAFLARHGRGHRILPSEINFRANIYGMKELGVERILSLS